MERRVSRLAPSPTGALHLGNARTFLINWAVARNSLWELLLRVENLDGPRNKPWATQQAIDDLTWLGMDFDGPITTQAADLDPYRAAMQHLAEAGLTYPCALTRAQIEQASTAPHDNDHELRFPEHLRPVGPIADSPSAFVDEHTNYRLLVEDAVVPVTDTFAGTKQFNPFREIGDFVIWTKREQPAYQLAVVVDDHRQGVTDVVRGMDLLPSAARQQLLYGALGWPVPHWWHLPLVLGPDGRRLAKRHGDTRISYYRECGIAPQRVIGLLAWWSGVTASRVELSAEEFRQGFTIERLDARPITFSKDDEQWLCGS